MCTLIRPGAERRRALGAAVAHSIRRSHLDRHRRPARRGLVRVELDDPTVLDHSTTVEVTVEAFLANDPQPVGSTTVTFSPDLLSQRVAVIIPEGSIAHFQAVETFLRQVNRRTTAASPHWTASTGFATHLGNAGPWSYTPAPTGPLPKR